MIQSFGWEGCEALSLVGFILHCVVFVVMFLKRILEESAESLFVSFSVSVPVSVSVAVSGQVDDEDKHGDDHDKDDDDFLCVCACVCVCFRVWVG